MKICEKCGTPYEEGAVSCDKCGQHLESPVAEEASKQEAEISVKDLINTREFAEIIAGSRKAEKASGRFLAVCLSCLCIMIVLMAITIMLLVKSSNAVQKINDAVEPGVTEEVII